MSTPPGWLPDPHSGPGMLRWWDGGQWTQATQPAGAPQGPPPSAPAAYGGYAEQPPAGPYPGEMPGAMYGGTPPGGMQASTQPGGMYVGGQPGAAYKGRSGRSGGAAPVVLGVGGAVLLVIVVVVAVVVGLGGDDKTGTGGSTASPSGAASTGRATGSPVVGRVEDKAVGISYAKLGSPWTDATGGNFIQAGYFTAGQVSVVQAPFEEYASFNATSLSGLPRTEERKIYQGPQHLPTVSRRVTDRIIREHFNLEKTRTPISSGAYRVDGHDGWLEKFRLDFTQAKAKGWKFTADTVAILLIDIGQGRLGVMWLSLPDTFPNQGDIDQILGSVQVTI